MLYFDLTATFTKGYIAEPYWPEMARLIDIQEQSGVNRARSAANRRKALEEYLRLNGMTVADYDALETLARRPFHTDADGAIIIPTMQVHAFLVAVCHQARSATRPCPPDQVRTLVDATEWATGKSAPDGVWERFVTVNAGTGAKLSNQRGLRRSSYIADFTATGRVGVDPQFVKPDVLRAAIAWGGQNVGIGAARKMGWGRFTLDAFAPVAAALAAE